MLDINSTWVRNCLSSMSIEQKIGQLLHPYFKPEMDIKKQIEGLCGIQVGGAFFFPSTIDKFTHLSHEVQKHASVPVIISSDLENGAGRMINDGVTFPDNMAIAATRNTEFAMVMGESAAKEGRECGLHWSFGPVVDINANPYNPITNTRSFGDDPDVIAKMSTAMINGMQRVGMAACAKHFPGDGYDDRDQHLCTTVNPLTKEEWMRSCGAMFQSAIDSGVYSIMVGHISLPSIDSGESGRIEQAPPAVMSHKIVTGLLRKEMGFEGVIITDAIEMGGSCTHYPESEVVVRSIEAGCDQILFCNVPQAFSAIFEAYKTGRLTLERIEASVIRILALKEKLGLNSNKSVKTCSLADKAFFKSTSLSAAENAITVVRSPRYPKVTTITPGQKVLSLHVRGDGKYNVDKIDELLLERGVNVVRWDETHNEDSELLNDLNQYDHILMHTVFGPTWSTNRIRLAGNYNRALVRIMKSHHKSVMMTSFGSPYHLYEFPLTPTYINAYSPDESMQKAYIKLIFGEINGDGVSPVDIEKMFISNRHLNC
ncbi:glycoside hydrolase family 3 protein [Vibrio mediterranei]